MTIRLLCIGLNPAIDMTVSLETFTVGAVNRAMAVQSEPAGKALNVATIISQLKARFGKVAAVRLSGFLGADNQQEFLAKFDKFSIQNHCITVAGATRQNIKVVQQDGTTTDINGVGFCLTADDKAKFFAHLNHDLAWADFVVLSGSLPQGFDLSDFEKLLSMLSDSGKSWAVDTSGQALKTAIQYQPFLIKPNEHELADLVGRSCDGLDEQLSALSNLTHLPNIVVSMGDKGVHWFTDGKVLTANAPTVSVKSTVGAGDTLLSALVFGLFDDTPKQEILKQAVAMAGFAVSQVGFELADDDDLTALSAQITVNEQTIF